MATAKDDIKLRLRGYGDKNQVTSLDLTVPVTPREKRESSKKKNTPKEELLQHIKQHTGEQEEEILEMAPGNGNGKEKDKPTTMEGLADLISSLTTEVQGLKNELASKSTVNDLETLVKDESKKLQTTSNQMNADHHKLQMLTLLFAKIRKLVKCLQKSETCVNK